VTEGTGPFRSVASRRAFSLIELLVVVAMLGVAAGLLVPRLAPSRSGSFETEVDAIASVLTAVAQRDAVSSQRLAIEYNPEENELSVLVFQKDPGARNEEDSAWRRDPFLGTLRLGGAEIDRAIVGGARFDEEAFRIDLAPGTPREDITLIVVPRGGSVFGELVYRVELPSYSVDARAMRARSGGEALGGQSTGPVRVDLDESGLTEEAW